MEVEEAAKAGDVVMMLVPDELCADIYNSQVAPYMTEMCIRDRQKNESS